MSLYTGKALTALISAIKADAACAALVGSRVYTAVPQKPTFPYIVIRTFSLPYDAKGGFTGTEVTARIQVLSEYRGAKEVSDVVTALHGALHEQNIPVTGANLVNLRYDGGGDALLEPDGKRWQGAVDFRLVLTKQ